MFGLSRLEIYLIAGLIFMLVLGGTNAASLLYGRHLGVQSELVKTQQESMKALSEDLQGLKGAVAGSAAISGETLEGIKNLKIVNTTIKGQVQREITTNTVYANNCLPDSGVVYWNAANKGVAPSSSTGPVNAPGVPSGNGTSSGGRKGFYPVK